MMHKQTDRKFVQEYVDIKVSKILGPLLIDLIKSHPENILDYIVTWCRTEGRQYAVQEPLAQQISDKDSDKIHQNTLISQNTLKQVISRNKLKIDSVILSQEVNAHAMFELELMNRIKNRKKKNGISAEAYGNLNRVGDFRPTEYEKDSLTQKNIRIMLTKSFMFDSLNEEELRIIISAMELCTYKQGCTIINEGDHGNKMFLFVSGSLKCFKMIDGKEELVKYYEFGDIFGELSLLYNTPRSASIYSIIESTCYSLDRETFTLIVKRSAIEKRQKVENSLKRVNILKDLTELEISKLCDCLQTEKFKKNDFVITQGEEGNKLYFIQEGRAIAFIRDVNGVDTVVREYEDNDYFGEVAIIEKNKRTASIQVTSDVLVVLSLTRESFSRVLGNIKTLFSKRMRKYVDYKSR